MGHGRSDDQAASPVWLEVLAWGLPPVVMILAGLYYGPALIDDAYITFRYAENLASGRGLSFNPGEPVLGTTTPLFTAILAGLRVLGFDISRSARWLGFLSLAALTVIIQLLARRSLSLPIASALGLCIALHPDAAFIANSGMETGLSMVLVFGGLLLALQARYFLAGVVGGAAFLLRPDGALVVALAAGLVLLRQPRKVWQPLIAAAVVVLPWLVYATNTYGWPMPHSVAAKQLIHPASPLTILEGHFASLTPSLPLKIHFGLGLLGAVIAITRRSELTLVVLWMAAYTAGLAASGIAPFFPWYVTPLSVGLSILAAYGIAWPVGMITDRGVAAAVLLSVLAVLFIADTENWRGLREHTYGKEEAYLEIGNLLKQRSDPGDVVFVGEVGALSYVLMDQVIIDSAGINSPEVHRLRREDRERLFQAGHENGPEGSRDWVTDTIEKYQPRYITTWHLYLHMKDIRRLPWFRHRYKRIRLDKPELAKHYIFERR